MFLLSYIYIQIKHTNISQHHNNQPHATRQQPTALAVPRETGFGLISNVTLPNGDSPLLPIVTHGDLHCLKTHIERPVYCKHFFSTSL